MNKPLSPLRRFLLAFSGSLEPKPASVIYAIGVFVWVSWMVVLGLRSGENDLPYALLDGSQALWQSAFAGSLLAVALASLVYVLKSKRPILSVLAYLIVYASPYALLLLGLWALDAIYFQHPATVETVSMLAPIFVIFYMIGIIYMRMRASRDREEAHLFFILPTFTVVILLIGLTTYKVFTSNEYTYRNAFQLAIQSVDRAADPIKIIGTLTLNKGGNYDFTAISSHADPLSDYAGAAPLSIRWDKGASPPSTEGEHEFFIALPQSDVTRQKLEDWRAVDPADSSFGGPEIYLQISLKDNTQNSRTPLRSLPIWLADFTP